MSFSVTNQDYMWKISLFGPFNVSLMVLHQFFECIRLPMNWVYIVVQDVMMATELVEYRRGPEHRRLGWSQACAALADADWGSRLYLLSVLGAHVVLFREMTTEPPAYCQAVLKEIGWQW